MDEQRSNSTQQTAISTIGEIGKRTHKPPKRLRARDSSFAVMTDPFTELTEDQVNHITNYIERCVSNTKNIVTDPAPHCPSLSGQAYSEGALKLRVSCIKDAVWLQRIVATLASPIPGTRLVVKRQRNIPKRIKSAIMLRFCSDEPGSIQNVLIAENECYHIRKWSLYKAERFEDCPGVFLVVGIPASEIPEIMARERKISYRESVACIRFYGSTGVLQDFPPSLAPAQQPG